MSLPGAGAEQQFKVYPAENDRTPQESFRGSCRRSVKQHIAGSSGKREKKTDKIGILCRILILEEAFFLNLELLDTFPPFFNFYLFDFLDFAVKNSSNLDSFSELEG
jgi:hypothetical protein